MNTYVKPTPLPDISHLPVRYVLTDVDDTLTWQGRLPEETFNAMHRLQQAGIALIPVTGACGGWCDCLVRTWPVKAVIGESGAFWMEANQDGAIQTHFMEPEQQRLQQMDRLQTLQQQLLQRFPFARATVDQQYRLTDIAFDIGQQNHNSPAESQQLMDALAEQPVQARLSSIHINVWYGQYSKASTARHWLQQTQGLTHTEIAEQVLFIGDSGNDQTMFEEFPLTVGVANVAPFLETLPVAPRYITQGSGGYGFAEMVNQLLKGR